ncbi:MAG: hypothetical protein RSB20_04285 [Clostridia bacterium]
MLGNGKVIAISIFLCLLLCYVVILYSVQFVVRVVISEQPNTFIVTTSEKLSDYNAKKSSINFKNYTAVYLHLGNGVYTSEKSNVFVISGQVIKKPYEALSNRMNSMIGDVFTFQNNKFTIVGVSNFDYGVLVDMNDVNTEVEVDTLIFDAKAYNGKDKVFDELSAIYGAENVQKPEKISVYDIINHSPFVLALGFITLISLLSILLSFAYLLSKCRKSVEVFKMQGYTNERIINMFLMAFLLLMTIVFLVGGITYVVLERLWFVKTAPAFQVVYLGIKQYLMVDLVYLAVLVVSFLPVLKRLLCRSVVAK